MGFYHLGLYSIRKKEKSALYFGLFCFLISIRTLVTDQCYFFTIFPSTVWELGLKLEYLTITLGAPVFLLFLANIFPDETHTTLNKLIQYPSYIISLFVALFPTRIFSHALVYMQMIILFLSAYSLYVMLKASFRKKEGALSFLFGSFAFILFIVKLG